MEFVKYPTNATTSDKTAIRRDFLEKYYKDYRSHVLMAQRLNTTSYAVSGFLTRMGLSRQYPALTCRRMSVAEEDACIQDFLNELATGEVNLTKLARKYKISVDRVANILRRRDVISEQGLHYVSVIDVDMVYEDTLACQKTKAKQDSETVRRCLCCGKEFFSTHVGNRMCSPCKTTYC